MYLTIKLTDEAKRRIAKDGRLADRVGRTVAGALEGAAAVGAEEIRQALYLGELGLNPSSAEGLAGSVSSWMLQRAGAGRPVAAIGVAANTRAAAYARVQAEGGTITPRKARALAVPISAEAKGATSPRDMPGLVMIKRPGKPPLLVRPMSRRGRDSGFELHWVLVPSVTIPPTDWLNRGARQALPAMLNAFTDSFRRELESRR